MICKTQATWCQPLVHCQRGRWVRTFQRGASFPCSLVRWSEEIGCQENDVDDDRRYSLEMGWLCSEIADDWQVLFLWVLPKMTRGKTLKSEEIDGTWRMDGWFLLLDAVMLLHHRARQPYMTMMLQWPHTKVLQLLTHIKGSWQTNCGFLLEIPRTWQPKHAYNNQFWARGPI